MMISSLSDSLLLVLRSSIMDKKEVIRIFGGIVMGLVSKEKIGSLSMKTFWMIK